MTKQCKKCGTFDNLRTRNIKGKLFQQNICKDCFSQQASIATKKAQSQYSEEKQKEISNLIKQGHNKRTEEEKRITSEKQSKSIKEYDKDGKRAKKISDYHKNMTLKEKTILKNKQKQGHKNIPKTLKEEQNKNRSKALKKIWSCMSQEELQKRSRNLSKNILESDKTNNRGEKISKALQKYNKSLTKKERKYRSERQKKAWKDIPDTRKKEINAYRKKVNIKIFKKRIKEGTHKTSKIELTCLDYIKENLDENVQYQVHYKYQNRNWFIDFYLPKFDVYIQLDGVYWHGHLLSEVELQKTRQGKVILKTKEKDLLQNKIIQNLIRVSDIEFKNKPYILEKTIDFYLEYKY